MGIKGKKKSQIEEVRKTENLRSKKILKLGKKRKAINRHRNRAKK